MEEKVVLWDGVGIWDTLVFVKPVVLSVETEIIRERLQHWVAPFFRKAFILKTERREQHLTPGKFTPLKLPEGNPEDATPLLEFSRHRLRVIEKMGEGSFGMIHLCETEGVPEYNGITSYHKKQVIVKSVWRGCTEATKQEFLRESCWMGTLRDANVARVVGVCSQEEPFCILQDYCEFGDLPTFLQLQSTSPDEENPALSYGCLIYMATQVASGMKYLESLDMPHRDLAARNCLVGKSYHIKVSDHAMYCTKYESDYYISDTKAKLPIRWMAWESLLLLYILFKFMKIQTIQPDDYG
uniref:Protein kinase domain-containing protein n=1 Tax=Rhodnius prolixus TaxID=13249 RepID=T1HCC8_RHOPR